MRARMGAQAHAAQGRHATHMRLRSCIQCHALHHEVGDGLAGIGVHNMQADDGADDHWVQPTRKPQHSVLGPQMRRRLMGDALPANF